MEEHQDLIIFNTHILMGAKKYLTKLYKYFYCNSEQPELELAMRAVSVDTKPEMMGEGL